MPAAYLRPSELVAQARGSGFRKAKTACALRSTPPTADLSRPEEHEPRPTAVTFVDNAGKGQARRSSPIEVKQLTDKVSRSRSHHESDDGSLGA